MKSLIKSNVHVTYKKIQPYLGMVLGIMLFAVVPESYAALSDIGKNVEKESGSLARTIIVMAKYAGIVIFAFALGSAIMEKKKERPLSWQIWGMVGGVLLTMVLFLVGETGESVSGQKSNASQVNDAGF